MILRNLSGLIEPVVCERSRPEHGVLGLDADEWPAPGATRGKARLALLAHGVACTWTFMQRLGRDLERLEGSRGRFYAQVVLLAHDWRRGVDENASRLIALLERLDGRAAIDLYGYSQGGLLMRRTVELAGDKARTLGLRHVFTFNAPHGGSPLAHVSTSRLIRWGSGMLGRLAVWHCDGIRDLIPGSALIAGLGRPPDGVGYTFLAGNSGWSFLRGITQPLFGAEPNDGVASVGSQLDAPRQECAGVVAAVKSRIARLVYPWEHFSIARGLAPAGVLETIAGRLALGI